MIEIYKHYATDEIIELEIISQTEKEKVGYSKKHNKHFIAILDYYLRWQIKGTSYVLEEDK